jgi:membrane dipeptidase
MEDFYVIDGCAFTEGDFIGLSEKVKRSPMSAFFLTLPGSGNSYEECTVKIGGIFNMADDPQNGIVVARTVDDIREAKRLGKKAVILTFQDPLPVGNSLDRLRTMYELGLRVMQMTYNKSNYIGTGCVESEDGGLTDFGRAALKKMNELGIVADVSHCGHRTTLEVIELSDRPVVISHACPLVLTDNPRNKTDSEIRLLKDNGGVLGLSSWGPLCWKNDTKGQPSMADFVDHIDYVVNLVGIDHVGFGGDSTLDDTLDTAGTIEQAALYAPVVAGYNKFAGTDPSKRHAVGIEGSWELENVFEEMRRRKYSQDDIAKFAGGNFLRVLEANWK